MLMRRSSTATIPPPTRRLAILNGLFTAFRMLVGATSAVYLVSKGVSESQIFWMKGMQAGVILVIEIPLGMLADKVGRRWLIFWSMVTGAGWLLITGLSGNVPLLFAGEFLNALSIGIMSGALYAEYIDSLGRGKDAASGDDLSTAMVLFNSFQFRSMAVAAGGGALLYGLNPDLPWLLGGIGCVLLAVFYILRPSTGTSTKTATKIPLWRTVVDAHRGFLLPLLVCSIIEISFQIAIQYWQLTITLGSTDGIFAGLIFGATFVLILLVQSWIGKLIEAMRHHRWLFLAAVTVPPLLWLGSYWTAAVVQIIAIVVYFWTSRGASVLFDIFTNEGISSEIRATVMAARSSLARILTLAVTPLVSVSVSGHGAVGAVGLVAIVAVIGAICGFLYLGRHTRPTDGS